MSEDPIDLAQRLGAFCVRHRVAFLIAAHFASQMLIFWAVLQVRTQAEGTRNAVNYGSCGDRYDPCKVEVINTPHVVVER